MAKELAKGVKGEESGTEDHPLKAGQQTALELLVAGKSMAETARSAGVGRTTLYRWLKEDMAFQAAYNQWHEEMQESGRCRLLTLTDKATAVVEKALEAGDARTALQLLKGMGILSPVPQRPTDAEELTRRAELEKRRRAAEMDEEEGEVRHREISGNVFR